jgi:hypothetical protein
MKNKITLVLTILGIYANCYVHAQINGKLYGQKEDFIAMAKRPLLVELLEEDPEIIKNLSYTALKKKAIRDSLVQEYKTFIFNYNKMIKSSVEKYWKYNEKVEYKTASEVNKLKESKNNKYVVLSYILQQQSMLTSMINNSFINHLEIPAISYNRIEQPDKKTDYKICMPSSGILKYRLLDYRECDFKFALIEMQSHLKWMIQNNKTVEFQEYAEIIAKENCSKLKNMKLQVETDFLRKNGEQKAEAKEDYGHDLEFVTAGQLDSSYIGNKKGVAVLLRIPFEIMNPTSASGNMGNMNAGGVRDSNQKTQFYKIVVDCESNKILWADVSGGFSLKKAFIVPDEFVKKSDFKNMGQCK